MAADDLAAGFLVTFDVASDGRRQRVAKELGRYGVRVLHSVYDLDPPGSRRVAVLVDRLATLIEPDDHVLGLPYCPRCRLRWRGAPLDSVPGPGWVVS